LRISRRTQGIIDIVEVGLCNFGQADSWIRVGHL
jgi:hypothetical protein